MHTNTKKTTWNQLISFSSLSFPPSKQNKLTRLFEAQMPVGVAREIPTINCIDHSIGVQVAPAIASNQSLNDRYTYCAVVCPTFSHALEFSLVVKCVTYDKSASLSVHQVCDMLLTAIVRHAYFILDYCYGKDKAIWMYMWSVNKARFTFCGITSPGTLSHLYFKLPTFLIKPHIQEMAITNNANVILFTHLQEGQMKMHNCNNKHRFAQITVVLVNAFIPGAPRVCFGCNLGRYFGK